LARLLAKAAATNGRLAREFRDAVKPVAKALQGSGMTVKPSLSPCTSNSGKGLHDCGTSGETSRKLFTRFRPPILADQLDDRPGV
jgi:hypothetical protein